MKIPLVSKAAFAVTCILVILKLAEVITWSWWIILATLFIPTALSILVILVFGILFMIIYFTVFITEFLFKKF